MYRQEINEFINNNKDQVLSLWEEIVNIDSGTYDVEGVNKVSEVLEEEFKALGCSTKRHKVDGVGDTLVATFNEEVDSEPIVFIGHMDTVFSDKDTLDRPFNISEGIAKGPGVLDMKAGITIGVFVLKALKEIGYNERPIKFILSGDEESGHEGTNGGQIIMDEAKGAKIAINFETGRVDEGIVVGRKGSNTFRIKIKGVSAHSGNDPEKGRSAILEAAHKVIALEDLNDIPKGKLVNCGLIDGGVSDNTIPGECEIVVLARHDNKEMGEEIVEDIKKILNETTIEGTETTYELHPGMESMDTTDEVMELFEFVKETAAKLGFPEPHPVKVGGGSDSAYTVAAGVPTVCAMGAKGAFNHSEEEYAVVDSVFERIELVTNVVCDLDK